MIEFQFWEPEFSTYRFIFCPHRGGAHALEQATAYINEGYQDIIGLDLKSVMKMTVTEGRLKQRGYQTYD